MDHASGPRLKAKQAYELRVVGVCVVCGVLLVLGCCLCEGELCFCGGGCALTRTPSQAHCATTGVWFESYGNERTFMTAMLSGRHLRLIISITLAL